MQHDVVRSTATSPPVGNSLCNTLYILFSGSTLRWTFCVSKILSDSLEEKAIFILMLRSEVVAQCHVVLSLGSGDLFPRLRV
jgi:hypothetical protein